MLVYEPSTEDTVNSIESLLSAGVVDPAAACALLDRTSGVDELRQLAARLPSDVSARLPAGQVAAVCSAAIYCDLFARVRRAVRAGTPTNEIQRALDEEFEPASLR